MLDARLKEMGVLLSDNESESNLSPGHLYDDDAGSANEGELGKLERMVLKKRVSGEGGAKKRSWSPSHADPGKAAAVMIRSLDDSLFIMQL